MCIQDYAIKLHKARNMVISCGLKQNQVPNAEQKTSNTYRQAYKRIAVRLKSKSGTTMNTYPLKPLGEPSTEGDSESPSIILPMKV